MIAKPRILAAVTFLPEDQGGRRRPALADSRYMPHVVVCDPHQRSARVDENGVCREAYLGVRFTGDGQPLTPAIAHEVQLELLYPNDVDYSGLSPGATFTIREGGRVIGFGSVVGWLPN